MSLLRFFILLVMVCSPVQAQGAPPLDDLGSDLRGLRGINYLASYETLVISPPSNFSGIASSTAMWWWYDTAPNGTASDVDDHLTWLRKAGVNTVRVFLSFPAWEHFEDHPSQNLVSGKNDAVRRYEHFLGLCADHGIWCTPVLWDATGALDAPDPVVGSVSANLHAWHVNPGNARIKAFLIADDTLKTTRAGEYVNDFVQASVGAPAFGFWHLMNEPKIPDATATSFIDATLALIESADATQDTLLLSQWANDSTALYDLARDPRVDFLGIHPYGATRAVISAQVYDATHIVDPSDPSGSGFVRKPIVATEIGTPGFGNAYQDALAFAVGVPRPDLGPGETGVGYMPWVSHVGVLDYPFAPSNGLFYPDGEVREADAVQAFVDVALSQGVAQSDLFTSAQLLALEKASGSPLHRPQFPIPVDRDDFAHLESLAIGDASTYSWDDILAAMGLFEGATPVVDTLASATNGNPYGDVNAGIPFHVPVGGVEEQMLLFNFPRLAPGIDNAYCQSVPACMGGDAWLLVVALANAHCQTSVFDTTSACHLDFVRANVIVPWQVALSPYIFMQGPF